MRVEEAKRRKEIIKKNRRKRHPRKKCLDRSAKEPRM